MTNPKQEPKKKINKDFYILLPSMVCMILDYEIIPKYSSQPWFNEAWKEYRQHVRTTSMDEARMPGFIFMKYTNALTAKDREKDANS